MKCVAITITLLACRIADLSAKDLSPAQRAHKTAIYAARPDYPMEARRNHLTGTGIFAMHVRPNGTVSSVSVIQSTGHAILDQAAIGAFIRWRFWSGTPPTVKAPLTFSMKGTQY
jgi:TonB family protein